MVVRILNPKTGRYVNKNGPIGRQLQNEIGVGLIENPLTLKKVPSASKEGRYIERHYEELEAAAELQFIIPSNASVCLRPIQPRVKNGLVVEYNHRELLEQYGKRIFQLLPPDYIITKKIGRGHFGNVFMLCHQKKTEIKCNLALKIQKNKDDQSEKRFKQDNILEVKVQKLYAKHGIAPRIHSLDFFSHDGDLFSAIIMDRIDGTLSGLITHFPARVSSHQFSKSVVSSIYEVLEVMCARKLYHGDFHLGNIGFVRNVCGQYSSHKAHYVDLMIIDFGWASTGGCHPDLELSRLIGNFIEHRRDCENTNVYREILKGLVEIRHTLVPDAVYIPITRDDKYHQHYDKLLREEYEPVHFG